MTIPRLLQFRRVLLSLLDLIEAELIERGALKREAARTINAHNYQQH